MATKTFKDNVKNWIDKLKASDIDGCITGSCLLNADFDMWQNKPDIDVFVYSDRYMIWAIAELMFRYGLELGIDSSEISRLQEEQKMRWLIEEKRNKSKVTNITLATIKLHDEKTGIIINVSCKGGCYSVADVVNSFDMSIIMKGWDIRGKYQYDMTGQWGSINVATPNPIRMAKTDLDMVQTAYWIRQFDRVIKYWERGYDTRPMAKFYIEQIDCTIARGNIWTSEASQEFYDKYFEEFIEMREKISRWLSAVSKEM